MAPSAAPTQVKEPFPISRIADRYLLFDIDIISHCRRNHNVCGMLIGTIPNLSQQNIFLGIPVELMPEEARVLVESDAAFIVDDAEVHKTRFEGMTRDERLSWLQEMDRRGEELTRETEELKERRKDKALKEKGLRREVLEKRKGSVAESLASDSIIRDDMSSSTESSLGFIMKGSSFSDSSWTQISTSETSLFDSAPASPAPSVLSTSTPKGITTQKHFVTPTTSYPPVPTNTKQPLPAVPKSYPLFRYLHSLGYYHMPGLRFGCHYNSYPGDPLRYHSHFAATGLGWDDEFELLDIVGGGRLATGTKKAYMIGGEDPDAVRKNERGGEGAGLFSDETDTKEKAREVRAFSIEWAAI